MRINTIFHNILFVVLASTLFTLAGCSIKKVENNGEEKTQLSSLYNAIVLPEQWPPRYDVPDKSAEMLVPYLKNKPKVIPVNIGRQLFVDDFLISETNLERIYHQPTDYTSNPILKADRDWEYSKNGRPYAAPFSDGIWYDELDNKFKMWYLAAAGEHVEHNGFYTCYAESEDGKKWRKPKLDIVPGTNIVDTFQRDAATVWLDKSEQDPSKRFKFFNVESPFHFVLKYSPDGIHWSNGVAQSGSIGDRSTAFYNPFRDVWGLSIRYNRRDKSGISLSRERFYIENQDPEMLVSTAHNITTTHNDKNVVYWFGPEPTELRNPKFPDFEPGIYNMDVIAYESIMLGFFIVHKGPDNSICAELGIPKRNEVSIGYSRDGFHFDRPTNEVFLGVNESTDAWNYGNVQSVNGAPIIVGDSLYFYRSGRQLNDIYNDSHMSTGLATLRRDGFVSMKSGSSESFLTTEELNFDGEYLFVNADVNGGELLVEVLDGEGIPVEGYSKQNCVAMQKENSTKYMISWGNKKDLTSLKGKNIRLKFYLANGELYSFWISPWETGESRGYTAGGGPGLSLDGIDQPFKK